jgi:hypothetical protein
MTAADSTAMDTMAAAATDTMAAVTKSPGVAVTTTVVPPASADSACRVRGTQARGSASVRRVSADARQARWQTSRWQAVLIHLRFAANRSRWSRWLREELAAGAGGQLAHVVEVVASVGEHAGGGQAHAVPGEVVCRGQRHPGRASRAGGAQGGAPLALALSSLTRDRLNVRALQPDGGVTTRL